MPESPACGRERARQREDLLRATKKELDKIVQTTRRAARRLKDESFIRRRVDKTLDRFRMRKHYQIDTGSEQLRDCHNQASIAKESALDGSYVVRTRVPPEVLSGPWTVETYKGFSTSERGFRTLKYIDLSVRPMYHRLADRVRVHVFLCMLASHVEWHIRRSLPPSCLKTIREKRRPWHGWWLPHNVRMQRWKRLKPSAHEKDCPCKASELCSEILEA